VPSLALDWGDLFARYEAMAVSFARGLTGDAELARDLYQEAARATWERAARGAAVFTSSSHARNYLFSVLRNLAVDARAGRRRAPTGLDDETADPAGIAPAELAAAREAAVLRAEALRRAFASLPLREQEALSLRFLEGRSFKEIAAATGRSISTLHSQVEAGLARLRRSIGKPDDAE
jgi:RNA polymerase sigma-70 factor (ECF subfamily)